MFFRWVKKANSGLNGIYEYNDQRVKELNNEGEGGEITTYESGEYVFFMIIAFILFVATLFTVRRRCWELFIKCLGSFAGIPHFAYRDKSDNMGIYKKGYIKLSQNISKKLLPI